MTHEECRVGMRVLCIEPLDDLPDVVGLTGTIVTINAMNPNWVGVDFDADFEGAHECGGLARYGRYGAPSALELLKDFDVNQIKFTFDELMSFEAES